MFPRMGDFVGSWVYFLLLGFCLLFMVAGVVAAIVAIIVYHSRRR